MSLFVSLPASVIWGRAGVVGQRVAEQDVDTAVRVVAQAGHGQANVGRHGERTLQLGLCDGGLVHGSSPTARATQAMPLGVRAYPPPQIVLMLSKPTCSRALHTSIDM